jgi:putative oxidoreductase
MKIASLIARILLGLVFLVFGLNGFLQFIPPGPMPTGVAGQFAGALMASHFVWMVSGFQVLCGVLLLVNRYVPLALVILAAEIVNILTFHLLMAPSSIPMALVVAILWVIVAARHWQYLSGIFVQRTE